MGRAFAAGGGIVVGNGVGGVKVGDGVGGVELIGGISW